MRAALVACILPRGYGRAAPPEGRNGSMASDTISSVFPRYAHGEHRPLTAYAGLAGGFNALLAGFLLATRQQGQPLPERLGSGDLLLLGVAAHKLSRLVARD